MMPQHCIDNCKPYKETKCAPDGARYWGNVKWCKLCSIRIRWDGQYCPCCKARLRSRSRHNHSESQITRQEASFSRIE